MVRYARLDGLGLQTMFKKFVLAAAAALAFGGLAVSAPAQAAVNVCSASQLANAAGATACVYVAGNANSNATRADQQAAIGALGAATFVYNFGTNGDNSFLDGLGHVSLSPISFGSPMLGETIVGMHFGGGKNSPFGQGPGGFTAFYLFNFVNATTSITLANSNSLSNAHLYATQGVPEPAAWGLMILGFGAVGATLRRRTAALRRFAIA